MIQVFWNMTPCLPERNYRRFERNICTNFSVNTFSTLLGLFRLWIWREKFFLKRQLVFTKRCGAKHSAIKILSTFAVKISYFFSHVTQL